MILGLLDEAILAGARREKACAAIGLCARTVGRWRGDDGGKDGRREGGVSPAHKLTAAEIEFPVATGRERPP